MVWAWFMGDAPTPGTTPGAAGLDTIRRPGVIVRGALTLSGGIGQPPGTGGTQVVMRSRRFKVGQGDQLPIITAQLFDEDTGTPVVLTGASVRFSMARAEDGVVKINRAVATIVDAGTGEVAYAWTSSDTNEAGVFEAEWEVTIGGKPLTFPNEDAKTIVLVGAEIRVTKLRREDFTKEAWARLVRAAQTEGIELPAEARATPRRGVVLDRAWVGCNACGEVVEWKGADGGVAVSRHACAGTAHVGAVSHWRVVPPPDAAA